MKYMNWGWSELQDAPISIRDRIVEVMKEEHERSERERRAAKRKH